MKSWLTTLHGIAIAVLMLSKIWAPADFQSKINDTIMILTATGFFAAKDFNTHSSVADVEKETSKESEKSHANS